MAASPREPLLRRIIPGGLTISPIEIVAAGIAVALLLWAHTLSVEYLQQPLFVAPLAATIAIVFTTPGMDATRSWNVIAGQTLSALVTLGAIAVVGASHGGMVVAPIALMLALVVMRVGKCLHPPACATVLVICLTPATHHLSFALFPIMLGSVFVICLAWIVHVVEARIPARWGGRTTPGHGQP